MVSSQLPAIVETVNPTSLRASEPSSQPSQEQQSLEQGHGDFPSGSTAFVHDFGPQFAFTEGYSHTAHPSVHFSHTPNPLFESAAGTTEGTHDQPQSTRRQQAQVHDTPHQKEWDQVPLFLQNTLKASLLVSCMPCIDILLLIIVGFLKTLLSGDAGACSR
jgi:hypothetical protein